MSKNVSVKGAAQRAKREDKRERAKTGDATTTLDSFVNYAMNMGIGSDNPMTGGTYGFNPITRIRTLLEWIHRGSWVGGMAVDVVADDMTRSGVSFVSDMKPEDEAKLQSEATALGLWDKINETIKWSRLYGGAVAVMLIEGQDPSTPLRPETVGPDQFKGLLVLDRWMVEPSLENLVKDFGPSLGLPKFYRVTADAPALPRMTVHYSRVLRMEGVQLPYWQRVQENLWGISVLERIYDRMIAFDSATTGAAQLVYKSYIRTLKIKGLRQVVAAGGQALAGLNKYTDMMRRFQGIEGMTMIDGDDEFNTNEASSFSGLSDALQHFGEQLSGALGIPLVRLFGQSPSGLNSTGESDLRMYYDGIKQKQEKTLKTPLTLMYRLLGQSLGLNIPEEFAIKFNPLWQLSEAEKATVAKTTVETVSAALTDGLITPAIAMKELKQSSEITGIFTNISDEDIASAEEATPDIGELLQDGQRRDEEEHQANLEGLANPGQPGGEGEPVESAGPEEA